VKPSQNTRVLAALQAAGDRGIGPVDFLPPTLDGGEPITRLAARVDVLNKRGFRVVNLAPGNRVAHYVLRADGRRAA
jgi:hypothetical protein